MYDFPERRFLLVGDSGEADLEVYTELAVAYPGRIVAVFIRDVTTPEQTGYFDSGFRVEEEALQQRSTYRSEQTQSQRQLEDSRRPILPPRLPPRVANNEGPLMGDLIDLSEEPETVVTAGSSRSSEPASQGEDPSSKKPPPRPSKPTSLRSSPAVPAAIKDQGTSNIPERKKVPPPPAARKPTPGGSGQSTPRSSTPSANQLSKTKSDLALPSLAYASRSTTPTPSSKERSRSVAPPPPPPPRRRGTPSSIASRSSPHLTSSTGNSRRPMADSLERLDSDQLAPSPGPSLSQQGRTNTNSSEPGAGPVDKRLDLWRRRLERAHDTLDGLGVRLYTWRRGDEVIEEAVGIVREELRSMGVSPGTSRKG